MSHMLEEREGRVMMAWAGLETPWHGLGKRVPTDLTAHQMLEAADLDWTVSKHPTFFKDPRVKSGDVLQSAEGVVLVRDDDMKVLDQVGENWEPVQNQEAAEFFHDFVMEGGMEMHTAGSLQDGKIVWMLAKVKESFTLFKKDTIESFLLFTNHHKYGASTDVRFTPVRVVCWNTLSMALNAKGNADLQIRLSHRRKFDPDLVKETLGLAHIKLDAYKEAAEFMGKKKYTWTKVEDYFDQVFPSMSKDKKQEQLSAAASQAMTILENSDQPGAEFGKGTWWEAFNAVTYLTDHVLGRSNDTRLQSAWYGANRQKKNKALELAIDFAGQS